MARRIPRRLPARRPLCGALLLAMAAGVQAQSLPTGEHDMSGIAGIVRNGTGMTVTQDRQGAVINWTDFSIGEGYSVTFDQPNSSSVALNRVVGDGVSELLGSLDANGHVFLVNPNGILFGAGARVDVGGLVASTLGIGDADFLSGVESGRFVFAGENALYGEGVVSIEAGAELATRGPGGTLAFLAQNDVVNAGTIRADRGSAILGQGSRIVMDAYGDGLTQIAFEGVQANVTGTRIENTASGVIRADGGQVVLASRHGDGLRDGQASSVVNRGIVRARTLQAIEGRIVLDAPAADVRVTATDGEGASAPGLLDAGASGSGDGGEIALWGRSIAIDGTLDASASGTGGGGRIAARTTDGADGTDGADATGGSDTAGAGGDGRAAGAIDVSGRLLANGGRAGGTIELTGGDGGHGGAGGDGADNVGYPYGSTANIPGIDGGAGGSGGAGGQVLVHGDGLIQASASGAAGVAGTVRLAGGDAGHGGRGGDGGFAFSPTSPPGPRIAPGPGETTVGGPGGDGGDGGDAGAVVLLQGGRIEAIASGARGTGGAVSLQGGRYGLGGGGGTGGDGMFQRTGPGGDGGDGGDAGDGYAASGAEIHVEGIVSVDATGAGGRAGSIDLAVPMVGMGEGGEGAGGRGGIGRPGGSQDGDAGTDGATHVPLIFVSGQLTARGLAQGGIGGSISSSSSRLEVLGSIDGADGCASAASLCTLIDASGHAGGGRIGLSSSFQSSFTATRLGYAGPDDALRIRADATASGRGGDIAFTGYGLSLGDDPDFGENALLFSGGMAISADGAGRADAGTVSLSSVLGGIALFEQGRLAVGAPMVSASASGSGDAGGVDLAAPRLYLDGARLQATAQRGAGGRIGLDASDVLAFGPDASIDASALQAGRGGNVTLFGGNGLRAHGSLAARGAGGGDGGTIETSGGGIDVRGIGIDASAPGGVAGTWLIDPYDVYIEHGDEAGTLPENPFEPVAETTILDGDINAAFDNGTSVRIATGDADAGDGDGDIVFRSNGLGNVDIRRRQGDAELSFRLDAHDDIRTEGYQFDGGPYIEGVTIDGGDGALDVVFNSDANDTSSYDGRIDLYNATILTRGGDVDFFGQGDADTGLARGITLALSEIDTTGVAGDGSVNLRSGGDYAALEILGSRISTGDGDLRLFADNTAGSSEGGAARGVSIDHYVVDDGYVESVLQAGGGDISIAGIAQVDGCCTYAAQGVAISHGEIVNRGGDIDVFGRASSAGTGYLEQAEGVSVGEAGRIGNADAGRVRIVGEAATGAAVETGIRLGTEGACGGGGEACVAGTDVILQAATGNGDPALAFAADTVVQATRAINLRPGGVDADGLAYERADDAIAIGAGGGFSIAADDLDALQAPDLVIGSDLQAGAIAVDEAVARDGNLTLQAGTGSIALGAGIDLGDATLALLAGGDITQTAAGAIRAGSLLARSTGGDVLLATALNDVSGDTLAGDAAGDFEYRDIDALAIGTVEATGFGAAGNAPQAVAGSGVAAAGGDAFVRNLAGDLVLREDVSAGGDIVLATAGRLQNLGGAALDAGGRWQVWAATWEGETRGGLAGSGPLPNLYDCSFGGSCSVTVSGTANQFIYVQQPVATVTVDDLSREYGLDNPALTYGVDGIVLDDIAANVVVGGVSTPATAGSDVGDYAIDGTFSSPAGYAIRVLPGTLAVTPATLLFTANPYTRIYGDPNGTLGGTVTGFRNGDGLGDLAGTLVWTTDATQRSDVGNYAIGFGGVSSGNYVFVGAAGNPTALRIDPATLVFTANPYTRLYGDPNGTLGGAVTGFKNGEGLGDLAGTLVWTTDATQQSDVGNYAIGFGGVSAGNYVLVGAVGNATALRIDPATLVFTANPYTRIYGDPNGALGGAVTGFKNGEGLGDLAGTLAWTTDATQQSDVGNYAIGFGGVSSGNYVFVGTAGNATALRIDPATLYYIADPYSRQIGQPNGVLGGVVVGFRNGDGLGDLSGSLAWTSPADADSPVGVYGIFGGGLASGNYVFEQAPGNATALSVYGIPNSIFPPDLVRDPPDNYVYDRNIGAPPTCPVVLETLGMEGEAGGDVLAREWSRVKTRPNLSNCVQGNRRNGCDDF